MGKEIFPPDLKAKWEIHEWRHAATILSTDFPVEFDDLVAVLRGFTLPRSMILAPGGNKSPIAKALDGAFAARQWKEKDFEVKTIVDGTEYICQTHHVDYHKNRVAIETEWSNKDPFFARDLNNFRLLFESRVISVGAIITRGDSLQQIFNKLGKGSSYGASTTHVGKLLPMVEGGGAGGCPVLAFGITDAHYDPST